MSEGGARNSKRTGDPAGGKGKRKPYESPAWEVEKAMLESGDTSCAKADSSCVAGGPGPIQS